MIESAVDWIVEATNAPVLYMPRFGLAQVLDILIVAALLYTVVKWIKRTRAWILLRGLGLILVIAVMAEIFELVTVQWIVDNAVGMGLVVVVILFQPELRKALEQIGRTSSILQRKGEPGEHSQDTEAAINEIMRAAATLSKAKTGGLIVMERGIELGEYERTGVPVDARVSAQLLVNIFERNTPLHDGAVIVKENRISAAACILPIAEAPLDSSFGTRHRAACGVSEISDAMVVVVSEETGSISLAVGGKIMRDLKESSMRELLLWGPKGGSALGLFGKEGGAK